jgi:hypothetical protein
VHGAELFELESATLLLCGCGLEFARAGGTVKRQRRCLEQQSYLCFFFFFSGFLFPIFSVHDFFDFFLWFLSCFSFIPVLFIAAAAKWPGFLLFSVWFLLSFLQNCSSLLFRFGGAWDG